MEIIRSPHDKLFGRVLSVKKNAVSLLRNILPESLQKHLMIEDIFFEKDSFIPRLPGQSFRVDQKNTA